MAESGDTASPKPNHSVLFVCWGNICRSPIAETIFKSLLEEKGISDRWTVDSAGTGEWNIGDLPDPRALRTLRNHGLDSKHTARVLDRMDFDKFEYLVCFDHKNIRDIAEVGPKGTEKRLVLLGKFDPRHVSDIIEDPYFLNYEDFETTYQTCLRACTAFLDSIEYDYV